MNAILQELYQQVVLEHNRNPRNCRVIDGGRTAEQYNRICGDRVTVYVRMEDAVIRDVSFQGSGCAILVASASLMTERVMGQTLTSVRTVVEQFHEAGLLAHGASSKASYDLWRNHRGLGLYPSPSHPSGQWHVEGRHPFTVAGAARA